MKTILSFFISTLLFACTQSVNSSDLKINEKSAENSTLKSNENIEGVYINTSETSCYFKLNISKNESYYLYEISTDEHKQSGKISLVKNEDEHTVYLTFEGIEWAENEGQLNEAGEPINKNISLPMGVEASLIENEITIQNYGNAMNSYIKFSTCEDKYIVLRKR